MNTDLSNVIVAPTSSIHEAIECIDHNRAKVALVVDNQGRLMDVITDGDVRRAILAGSNLGEPVTVLRSRKADSPYPQPVTAPLGTDRVALLRLMQEREVRQVPLLDQDQRVADLVTLPDLSPSEQLPLTAVIMAGGYGTRLRPLTDELPKPMLPVGDRPLLELIIEQLRKAGISRVNLSTHYKSELIAQHFGDGKGFGVDIEYVEEHQPLGTAGAVSKLDVSEHPLLVINGDILTQVDFRAMLDFHREHRAEMSVAVRQHEFRVPFGVVETEGVDITKISEKPVFSRFINAGIYLLNPQVCQLVPEGQAYDMPDLISRLVAEGRRVISFPIREYWLDIGQVEDYERALADTKQEGA